VVRYNTGPSASMSRTVTSIGPPERFIAHEGIR